MLGIPARDWIRLNARIGMMVGLAAIGAALGFAIGLELLQNAAIAEGIFPPPGVPVGPGTRYSRPDGQLWNVATTLQQFANVSGVLGALLLLWGGALDRFEDRIVEVIA